MIMMIKNRLYLLPFIISVIVCCIIGCTGKIDVQSTLNNNYPNGFEEFDEYRIFAHYDDSINGYDVKVMILPSYRTWRMSCRAVISLSNENNNIKIVHSGWLDTMSYDMLKDSIVMPKDTVIRLSYDKPTISNKESFTMDVFSKLPFFFYDIDFDGNEELLLNLYGQGQRWINAYEVVETEPDRLYSIYRKEPFTDLDEMTIIDPVNKTITNVNYEGHGEEWHTVYKITPVEYETLISEEYTDDLCFWGIGNDTIPQYRRIYPHNENDTTDWMPIKQRRK